MNKRYDLTPQGQKFHKWSTILHLGSVILAFPIIQAWLYPALFVSGQFFSPAFLGMVGLMAIFIGGMALFIYVKQRVWHVELTEESVQWFLNNTPHRVIPYQQLEKCHVIRLTSGEVVVIELWGAGRGLQLIHYQNMTDLAAELTQRAPAGVVTETISRFDRSKIPLWPFVLIVLLTLNWLIFRGHTDLFMLFNLLFLALSALMFQPLRRLSRKTIYVVGDVGLTILFGIGLYWHFQENHTQLKADYLEHPCALMVSLTRKTGCLASFQTPAQSQIVFAPDNQTMVYEFRHFFMRAETGVLIQPTTSWLTHFQAQFIPVGENSFFNTESWSALSRRLDITSGGGYVVSRDRSTHQVVVEPILAEREDRFFFNEEEEVPVLRWFSATGRYFVTATADSTYWVYNSTDDSRLPLPIQPDTAVFSADETELILLTDTELLAWDVTSQTGRTIAPRPAEWAEMDASCLRQTGEGQFLVVVDSFNLWWWNANTGQTQFLLNSNLPNECNFYTGSDWLFFHDRGDEKLMLYDLPSGELRWAKEDWGMNHWAVSPDGRYLAGSDFDYTYLFDFEFLRQQP